MFGGSSQCVLGKFVECFKESAAYFRDQQRVWRVPEACFGVFLQRV